MREEHLLKRQRCRFSRAEDTIRSPNALNLILIVLSKYRDDPNQRAEQIVQTDQEGK